MNWAKESEQCFPYGQASYLWIANYMYFFCHSFSSMQRNENAAPLKQKVVAQKASKNN